MNTRYTFLENGSSKYAQNSKWPTFAEQVHVHRGLLPNNDASVVPFETITSIFLQKKLFRQNRLFDQCAQILNY